MDECANEEEEAVTAAEEHGPRDKPADVIETPQEAQALMWHTEYCEWRGGGASDETQTVV